MRAISEAASEGDFREVPAEYLVLMIRAQLEVTVEFIHAHPETSTACREWGFKMLWKELAGN